MYWTATLIIHKLHQIKASLSPKFLPHAQDETSSHTYITLVHLIKKRPRPTWDYYHNIKKKHILLECPSLTEK